MNLRTIRNARRRLIVLTVATLLALSATYAPILMDGAGGTSLTGTVSACDPQTGGGGGC